MSKGDATVQGSPRPFTARDDTGINTLIIAFSIIAKDSPLRLPSFTCTGDFSKKISPLDSSLTAIVKFKPSDSIKKDHIYVYRDKY